MCIASMYVCMGNARTFQHQPALESSQEVTIIIIIHCVLYVSTQRSCDKLSFFTQGNDPGIHREK